LGFGHSIWNYLLCLFLFLGCLGQICALCKGVIQVKQCSSNFWDPIFVFCPKPSFILCSFFLLLNFCCQLTSFDSIIIHFFGRVLGSSFFKCSKAPLVCWQVIIPIYIVRIGFISIETITLMEYLGNWGMVALINTSKLLQDLYFCSLGLLPFQTHLRLMHNLFPLITNVWILPFKQFSKNGFDHLQEDIFKCLHEYSFSIIISNMSFDPHYTCLKSCTSLGFSVWFSCCRVILSFCMP